MNKFFFSFVLLLMVFTPLLTVDAEPYNDVYLDKRQFDLLDVCNTFFSVDSTSEDITDVGLDSYQIKSNMSTDGTNPAKPTHLIRWDTLNNNQYCLYFLSKLMYNWSRYDEIKLHIYVQPNDTAETKTNLRILYKDYNDETRATSGLQNYYRVYEATKHEWDSPSQTEQTAMQRFSNIDNGVSSNVNSVFHPYHKEHGNATFSFLNVQATSQKENITISSNQWTTITLNKDTIITSSGSYDFGKFMNLGIYRYDPADIIYIDSIMIIRKSIDDDIQGIPCVEYFEFWGFTSGSRLLVDIAPIFNIDFVLDDYDSMEVLSANFSFVKNGSDYYFRWHVNNTVTYTEFDETLNGSFIGYQINVQKSGKESHYTIYTYLKTAMNIRTASGEITYNWTTFKIELSADIKFILDVQYYLPFVTENKLEFTEKSHKWDMKDNAFTTLDRDDKGDTLLIKDIDSSGFRIPSLSDIKKVILSAFKPLFTLLIDIFNIVLEPLLEMLGLLEVIESVIDSISSFISDIKDLLSAIEPVIDAVLGAVDGLEGFIETIRDKINDVYGLFEDFASITLDFLAILDYIVANILTDISDFVTFAVGFISDAIVLTISVVSISLSIIALGFTYKIIFGMSKFNETGDIEDLYSIIETFQNIAEFVYDLFMGVWNTIAALLPG